MDELAVSVVPKERADMAAGIFGTVRVAGEDVALALATALLSGLAQARVSPLIARPEASSSIAERLATGDFGGASALTPEVSPPALLARHGHAFRALTLCLAGITLITALVVFFSLRPTA